MSLDEFDFIYKDSPMYNLSAKLLGQEIKKSVFTLDTLHDEICPTIGKKPGGLEDTMFDDDIVKDYLDKYGVRKHRSLSHEESVKDLFLDKTNIFLRDVFPNDSDKTKDGKGLIH
jgi:hypothetical protein